MTDYSEYMAYVKQTLSRREVLEQLAEECNELSKAALKLIRAEKLSGNYTPVTPAEANEQLTEEVMDVLTVLSLLDVLPPMNNCRRYRKWRRWAERLGFSLEKGQEEARANLERADQLKSRGDKPVPAGARTCPRCNNGIMEFWFRDEGYYEGWCPVCKCTYAWPAVQKGADE